jgi:nifR3 family TIM-barrel protein
MAGFSDVPHREICRQFGAVLNYTEFVAAEEIVTRSRRALLLLDFVPKDRPVVFQIFGNDPLMLLEAAQIIEELEPDIIDINMGCSTRRVSGRGAGVGMMRHPERIAKTFHLLTNQLSVPVTGKIRLGWEDNQNYLEIGRIMEENGAALVAIHPRTKEQQYRGKADWEAIARLKQSVNIPVIGNGDIWEADDIDGMKSETGCDAVMIGRGAIGNPWIFSRQDKLSLTVAQVLAVVRKHAWAMVDYYGERGLILFRKYCKRYLGQMPELLPSIKKMLQMIVLEEFLAVLDNIEHEFGGALVSELSPYLPASISPVQRIHSA